jgi:flagellar basal-body rod modification protein FlgD
MGRAGTQGTKTGREEAGQGGKMATAAGILDSNGLTAGQALTGKSATPMASSSTGTGNSSSTSSSDSSSATISANDFLTLLVTEMQNQDPTANTDPNEYINQLVNVNSLEQLISINQTLTTDLGSSTASSGNSPSGQASGATAPVNAAAQKEGASTSIQAAASSAATTGNSSVHAAALRRAPGNLGIPAADPAAQRVANALNGKSRAPSIAGNMSGVQ